MRKLRAGQTLYVLDNNGALQSYRVLTSCYGYSRGLIVTGFKTTSQKALSLEELEINEFGFVEYTPPNEAKARMFDGIEPTHVKWCRVYHSRRKAERKIKAGRDSVILPVDRLPAIRDMLRQRGRTHGLIPFYKYDPSQYRLKLVDRLFAGLRTHAPSEKFYMTVDGKVYQTN